MPSDPLSFSLIIPARNAAATIIPCLDAVGQSTLKPHEIILVDDASKDKTAAFASRFACRIISSKTANGSMLPRFLGASHAVCDLLVFIDADVIVQPDSFEKICCHFQNPQIQAVTGILSADFRTGTFCGDFKNEYMNYVFSQKIDAPDFLYGSIFAVRKPHLIPFEPIVQPFGSLVSDTELGLRLHKASQAIHIDSTIQVGHLKPYNLSGLLTNDFRVPFCFALLLLKYSGLQIIKKGRLSHVSIQQTLSLLFAALAGCFALLGLFTGIPWVFGAFIGTLAVYYFFWIRFLDRLARRRTPWFVFKSVALLPLDSMVMLAGMLAGLGFGIYRRLARREI